MDDEADPVERNKELLRRYLEEVWDSGDVEVIDEIFADIDGMRRKWGDDIKDRAELKSYLGGLVDKYENDDLTVLSLLADEHNAMAFWKMEMQLVDDHLGIKPSGRAASRRGVTYGRIEDGYLTRVIDISDSRELMPRVRRLARSELMSNMHEGVLIVDDDDLVVDVNEVALSAFSWEREAALDRPVTEVLRTDISIPNPGETVEVTGDGDSRHFEMRTSVITDPKDMRVGRALVLREITARKRYENQLQVLNRVLRHNLRNDLTVVQGHIQVASQNATEDITSRLGEADEKIEELLATAETARRVQSILDNRDVVRQDVAPLVESVRSRARDRYPLAIVDTAVADSLAIEASTAFEDALWELVANACEHGGDSPGVEIHATGKAGIVDVTVSDDGPGLPDHEREVLDSGIETPLSHGTGLGLWLAHWVIEASGGSLTFAVNDGTTARVSLPMAPTDGD